MIKIVQNFTCYETESVEKFLNWIVERVVEFEFKGVNHRAQLETVKEISLYDWEKPSGDDWERNLVKFNDSYKMRSSRILIASPKYFASTPMGQLASGLTANHVPAGLVESLGCRACEIENIYEGHYGVDDTGRYVTQKVSSMIVEDHITAGRQIPAIRYGEVDKMTQKKGAHVRKIEELGIRERTGLRSAEYELERLQKAIEIANNHFLLLDRVRGKLAEAGEQVRQEEYERLIERLNQVIQACKLIGD